MTTTTKDLLYTGHPGSMYVSVEDTDGSVRKLENHGPHSPDGHSWGYGGSGPAQLARDLLWDHLEAEPHPTLQLDFKECVVESCPAKAVFEIDSATITQFLLKWVEAHPDAPLGVDGL